MSIKFSDIIELFDLVNFGSPFDHEAYICKATGKTYFYSEYGDNEEELPDDLDEEKYLAIPHKNDLDLGRKLAFEFAAEFLPAEYENVRACFRHKGAYSRYKALLENVGKIEDWYQYEAERTSETLREWALFQDIDLVD